MWPVVLEVPGNALCDVAGAICAVKEQIRGVPEHVQNYGLPFRSLDDMVGLPDVVFNYLGQFGDARDEHSDNGLGVGDATGREIGGRNQVCGCLVSGMMCDSPIALTGHTEAVH